MKHAFHLTRCKCVHSYLYNLKNGESFFLPLIISRGRRCRPDSIWGEVVDHESGNRFDIRLEVRTQNRSVVRKVKCCFIRLSNSNFTSFAQTCFWSYHFFRLFPIFLQPFAHLLVNPHGCTYISSYETDKLHFYRAVASLLEKTKGKGQTLILLHVLLL